ncbi:MAG: tetratricopeptide repeat protein [Planctomycetota bacterium]
MKRTPAEQPRPPQPAHDRPSRATHLRVVLWVTPLLLLSGFAGLAYEVVWMRALRLVFGQGPDAIATLLTVFLAGLALGAAAVGRLADRLRVSPLVIYGGLELLVAITALAVPSGLDQLTVWLKAWGGDITTPSGRWLRGSLSALVLLPPTFFMGGTLPALSRLVPSGDSTYRGFITWVYGVNTLGAALGAAAVTLWWLPAWGLSASLRTFPLVNVAVGLATLVASRWVRRAEPRIEPEPASSREPPAPAMLWALAFGSGFVVLVLEVACTRLYALLLGQSSHAFGLMLTGFVAGLGGGALAASALSRRPVAPAAVLGCALMTAGLGLSGMLWLAQEITLLVDDASLSLGPGTPAGVFLALEFGGGLAVLLVPTFALGLIFPIALSWLSRDPRRRATRVGAAYALNTLGSLTGAVGGALVVVPLLSPEGTIVAAAIVAVLTGGFLWLRVSRPASATSAALGGAVAVAAILVALATSSLHPIFLLRNPSVYGRDAEGLAALRAARHDRASMGMRLAFARTDAVATVAVGQGSREKGDAGIFFTVNGKSDGSNLLVDMMNQVRTADWAWAFLPQRLAPRSALVIGLGTGVTAAELLRYPVGRVDVVEISDAVIEVAGRFFHTENGNLLANPRLSLIRGDGRNFAATTEQRYDIILSEPSNPWVAGMGFLFTREFFEILRSRLTPQGTLAQWVQTYGLTEELFRSVIAAFTEVFPRSYMVSTYPYGWDMILVGSVEPAAGDRPSLALMMERLAQRAPAAALEPYSLGSEDDIFFGLLAGPSGLRDYSRDAPIHTDDNGLIEFQAPALQRAATACLGLEHFSQFYDILQPADALLALSGASQSRIEQARARQLDALCWMRLRSGLETVFAMGHALSEEAHAALVGFAERAIADDNRRCAYAYLLAGVLAEYIPGSEAEGRPVLVPFGPGFLPEPARTLLRRAVELDPQSTAARMTLAINLEFSSDGTRYAGDAPHQEAIALYRSALADVPGDPAATRNLAALLGRLKRWKEAEQITREALELAGNVAELEGTLALALINQERFSEAIAPARRALALAPRDPLLLQLLARALLGAGEREEARRHARAALEIAPNDSLARALLAEIDKKEEGGDEH